MNSRWIVPSLAGLALAACASLPAGGGAGGLSAEVTRTAYGVPHIKADGFAGLGYGFGLASAEDNICEIADRMVTV